MRGMILVAIASILSSFASAQAPQKMPVKELIEKIKIVSPDGEANMFLMHQMLMQGPQTGSAFFREKVKPFQAQAWTAMHDFVSIQVDADMVKAKSTHMQVAKDVARALGDLFGWGDDAAKTFATSEIKDIRPARPYGGISATVYAGMDKFVPFSADSDWPNSPAIGEKTAEIQVIEGVSPKAVKGVFMVRALLKQAATKTGNAKVDQEIADAKKLAADSWTNWVATELFADLLIVRKTDSKKADDALRVISGSKYEDAKAKLDSAFEDGSVGGPLVGRMTLSEGAWLGPAVGATVLRLIAAQ